MTQGVIDYAVVYAAARLNQLIDLGSIPGTNIPREHIPYVLAPEEVNVTIRDLSGANPVLINLHIPEAQAKKRAYTIGFGHSPVPDRDGRALPVVGMFTGKLNILTVLMDFGLLDDRLHSHNGIQTSNHFLTALTEGKN